MAKHYKLQLEMVNEILKHKQIGLDDLIEVLPKKGLPKRRMVYRHLQKLRETSLIQQDKNGLYSVGKTYPSFVWFKTLEDKLKISAHDKIFESLLTKLKHDDFDTFSKLVAYCEKSVRTRYVKSELRSMRGCKRKQVQYILDQYVGTILATAHEIEYLAGWIDACSKMKKVKEAKKAAQKADQLIADLMELQRRLLVAVEKVKLHKYQADEVARIISHCDVVLKSLAFS